jgi:hypothetical protein
MVIWFNKSADDPHLLLYRNRHKSEPHESGILLDGESCTVLFGNYWVIASCTA